MGAAPGSEWPLASVGLFLIICSEPFHAGAQCTFAALFRCALGLKFPKFAHNLLQGFAVARRNGSSTTVNERLRPQRIYIRCARSRETVENLRPKPVVFGEDTPV